MTPKMPSTIYFAVTTGTKVDGPFFTGDFETELDAVLDQAVSQPSGTAEPFRIFRMDFDPDTNLPEHTTDVTEYAIHLRNAWLAETGRPLIAAE